MQCEEKVIYVLSLTDKQSEIVHTTSHRQTNMQEVDKNTSNLQDGPTEVERNRE